jgi:hypothetical protein
LPETTEIKIGDFVYPLSVKKVKKKVLDTDYIQVFTWVADDNYMMLESFNKGEDAYEFRLLDSELNESGKYVLKRGQGPRELLKPYFVCGTLEEIFIYDGGGQRILRCDKEFKDCKITRMSIHGDDFWGSFGYSWKSGYCLTCNDEIERPTGNAVNNYFLRDTRHVTGKETPFHKETYKYMERHAGGGKTFWRGKPHHARLIDNFAFIINLKSYTIYKYDLNGRLIKSVKIHFKGKTFAKENTKKIVAAWGDYVSSSSAPYQYPQELWPACWILHVGKGLAVGRRENYMPGSEKWITADYFDLELNFLGKIRLPVFKWWNHPSTATWVIDRFVFTRGDKLWISMDDDDTEEVFLEEWIFTYDK